MKQPRIICHVMSSTDGRILTDRWTTPFGGKRKQELMVHYAVIGKELHTDAWMLGKRTVKEGISPRQFVATDTTPSACPVTYRAEHRSARVFVVIDPEADILFEEATVRGDDIVTILPDTAPQAYLDYLRERHISYLFAGTRGNDLRLAMHRLAEEFDVHSLSLQGGGIINGAFLAAGLVDELSLLFYPGVDGTSDSVSVFHGLQAKEGVPAVEQTLELFDVKRLDGGVVWLRYLLHKD